MANFIGVVQGQRLEGGTWETSALLFDDGTQEPIPCGLEGWLVGVSKGQVLGDWRLGIVPVVPAGRGYNNDPSRSQCEWVLTSGDTTKEHASEMLRELVSKMGG